MTNNDFRDQARNVVDWMADYRAGVEALPVRSRMAPGDVAGALDPSPPDTGEPIERIMEDVNRIILPGMTHWQHPSFFAYFPANSSTPSILAEMVTATLAAQCMSWETSPAATELETHVLDWLRALLGLPGDFVGSIQDTASTATLTALIVARERATGGRSNTEGLANAPKLTTYCSVEAHSSCEKGVGIAGLGRDNLRKIPVDASFAMIPDRLERAIEQDLAAGHVPTCVMACLGTTGASGFDPLPPIAEICARHGVWLHVDAAWAGSALVAPEFRWMIDGISGADSFVFNPHKWLFTNFDCSAFYVKDPDALVRAMAIDPEYLKTREDRRVVNYRDWGVQLGRRFRALKLWFVIRSFGAEGLRKTIRGHVAWAKRLADHVAATPDFELLAPARLSLFCFRYRPNATMTDSAADTLNERLLQALNDTGKLYLTHTRVDGKYAIRFVVGQTDTEERHVSAAWDVICQTARALDGEA